jgi:hypothetical protein
MVGSLKFKTSFVLGLFLLFAGLPNYASAASATATPKPIAKPSAKLTPAAGAKATSKPSAKSSVKKTIAPKKAVVKKVAPKRIVWPMAKPSPAKSPLAAWPPKGYVSAGGIYAKIPTAVELTGIISAQKLLFKASQNCITNACGALFVASVDGCIWWEVDSSVYGPGVSDPTKIIEYGTLRTTAKGTKPKESSAILMVSSEPLAVGVTVGNIGAKCWSNPPPEKVPNNTYIPNTNR